MVGESRTNPTSLPPTPDDWRAMQIEELCERVTSGGTPSRQRPEFYENGVFSWFKTKELKDCVLYDSEERITQDALDSSSAKLFPPNTVLMAMYGDGITITSLGILQRQAATNQACCAMIPKSSVCEPRFLFYSLLNHREDFIRIASGGAQRNLSGSLIRRFALNMPPLPVQKSIAHILGTLDDKIELNRRMNAKLEAMARALFQSWFVDFDPVRAKIDGRPPVGMDTATAALFADSFQDSEVGPIPKGWEIKRLGDVADLNWGDTNTTKASYVPVGFTAFSASGADGYLPHFDFEQTGVVVSAIGANAGVTWLTCGKWSCIKNTLRFWTKTPEVSTEFLFFATYGRKKWPQRGSAQPFISQGDARAMKVLIPAECLGDLFGKIVQPWLEIVEHNLHESRTLTTLRDMLLPKLLSGELSVATMNA